MSQIKAAQFSEAEIAQIGKELKANQMTLEQAEPLALAKGMSATEFMQLKVRLQSNTTVPTEVKEEQKKPAAIITQDGSVLASKNVAVFGSELFTSKSLSFEPNQNMPTPPNYVLGPGDQLDINVYGVQQFNYSATISKNGTINIPNVGEVFLSGLAFEAAKNKLQKQIGKIYSTLAGNGSKLSVSVSNYRTILVTIIGAQQSGNYRLSSMSSVYNALHVAGGPSDIGSYRKIELIRNNKIIRTIDLYRFLTKGDQSDNVSLTDNDVIRIPSYEARVTLEGEIKRPGIFEMVAGENLKQVISYASGFTENAYKNRILVKQKTNSELKVTDLNELTFASYLPKAGDMISVDKILDRYENRVQIKGAVYRPGEYSLPTSGGMTIKDLLKKADGVTENVFLEKASLIRQKSDLTKEYISFNLQSALNGEEAANMTLQKEDVLVVFYNQELLDDYKLSIAGEIRKPGDYNYVSGMSLYDLLLESEFFTDLAASNVSVFRNKKDAVFNPNDKEKIITFNLTIDPKNPEQAATFLLEPQDHIVIRRIVTFETPQMVNVSGEILYPGGYAIAKKEERVMDFITRSGGITDEADTEAIKVIRNGLNIPIDWKRISKKPLSSSNLILIAGDDIIIPNKKSTVLISGSVMFDTEVPFRKGKNIKYYIKNAGGTAEKGWMKKVYVVHANGSASASGSVFGIRKYPKVFAGSKIIVPEKPERTKASTGEIVGIASVLTSLAGILLAVLK
ncbi:SLBB domain-containing protein [Flavobacterium sp.]|uniref:SLBB domain-containing protein n=1 Tax=Flavobacterium sp. TaxID=239 RepID=UPI001B7B9D4F|nr:SLBB domain-containing protein [Flavobacterium sp.]MBP6128077.1 SLBB domain-containing protein [Flavobacterium sp.]